MKSGIQGVFWKDNAKGLFICLFMCLKDFKLQPNKPKIEINVWKPSSETDFAKFFK